MEVKTLHEKTYLNLLKDMNTKKSGEQEYLAEEEPKVKTPVKQPHEKE